jgi:hypothetical protein
VREAFPTARVDAEPPPGSDTAWIVQEGEHKMDLYIHVDDKGAVIREVVGIFIRPDLLC